MAKKYLLQKKLTVGQVRPLIGHEDIDIFLEIIKQKSLTSRQVEKLIKKEYKKSSKPNNKNIDIINLEKELTEITGLKVKVNFDVFKQNGNIKLECKNLKEFNYIIEKIKS